MKLSIVGNESDADKRERDFLTHVTTGKYRLTPENPQEKVILDDMVKKFKIALKSAGFLALGRPIFTEQSFLGINWSNDVILDINCCNGYMVAGRTPKEQIELDRLRKEVTDLTLKLEKETPTFWQGSIKKKKASKKASKKSKKQ